MIIGIICGYDEAPQLRHAIDSIIAVVDHIVYVDGAYAELDWRQWSGSHASTDGSIELARSRGCEVIESMGPWPNQPAKRNNCLVGSPGDWYLQIDCDEVLEKCETDLRTILPHISFDWLQCRLYEPSLNVPRWLPRLFKHLGGLHYGPKHSDLFDGLGNKTAKLRCDKTKTIRTGGYAPTITIRHDRHQKDPRRNIAQVAYYKRREENKR